MIRAYKFLLRPTARQALVLGEMLGDHCSLYNGALEHRRTAYRRAGVTIRYGEQSAELKAIRAEDPGGVPAERRRRQGRAQPQHPGCGLGAVPGNPGGQG
ncbi:hypothetical protein GCM10023196_074120 [Actinoallomurus vinaceus]|uniref:Transposase putative helix-turn-helix domain-containing protein n=1 Tax=Actinoallomurus vinaceus TaxID=1080074 RepID=A0ABP8UL13_9ACTN